MTTINPTYQKRTPPRPTSVLDAHQNGIEKAINCVRIGFVQAFYPGEAGVAPATVDVLIAQQQVTAILPDGTQTLAPYPLLRNVPVVYPCGGGFTLTFPIAEGDECLLLFNDREIDNWYINGAGQPPTTSRKHDLSDGFALVGVRSCPRAIVASATAVQLRSDNYTGPTGTGECVEIGAGKISLIADEVVIHARHKLCEDAGGTGTVTTPTAITGYTQGVASTNNPPTPPEVPT